MKVACRVVPGTGAVTSTRLTEGLVNENYRIERDGLVYVLRLRDPMRSRLGSDHDWEARVLRVGASAGLTAPIVLCDPGKRILLTRWLSGETWTPAQARAPATVDRVVALIRSVHALPIPASPRLMTPRDWCDLYARALQVQIAATGYQSIALAMPKSLAEDRLRRYESLGFSQPVLCHSDLHRQNLLVLGPRLILLDWEYAHVGNPLWDLAGWNANNDFEAAARDALLQRYLGKSPSEDQLAQFALIVWIYDFVCLLWAELYCASRERPAAEMARRATALAARLVVGGRNDGIAAH